MRYTDPIRVIEVEWIRGTRFFRLMASQPLAGGDGMLAAARDEPARRDWLEKRLTVKPTTSLDKIALSWILEFAVSSEPRCVVAERWI
jgi:hypothetical protein